MLDRVGTYDLLLEIFPDLGGPSRYSGSVAVSSGTIANAGFQEASFEFTGARNLHGRVLQFRSGPAPSVDPRLEFVLDFGATQRSTALSVNCDGDEHVTGLRLVNATHGQNTVLLERTEPSGYVVLSESILTPQYTGLQVFRIEYRAGGSETWASGEVIVGRGVQLVSVATYGAPPDAGDDSAVGCLAGSASNPVGSALIVALAMVATVRRRLRRA
jgi:hypothetical protein